MIRATSRSTPHRLTAVLAPALLLVLASLEARADSPLTGYFVDCDSGNDSRSGTSPQEAWRTLRKVSSTVKAAGSDVFLKAGSTCSKQRLIVDWGGTPANRAIIGSYYVNDSGAHEGFEGSSRPTITGTYGAACRSTNAPSTCPVGINADDQNAMPPNQWDGLIHVRASYVTVQDIAVADSSGSGVSHAAAKGKSESNVTFQNLSISRTFNSGIRLERVRNDVLRDNRVDLVSLMKVDGRTKYWPPGILVTDSAPANLLVEGNTLSNSGGEGIGVLRSSHTIIRGNTVANNRRPLIYLDNASENVVEHNLLLGNGYMNGVDESFGVGVSIAVEPYKQGMRNSVSNVLRNNLMANTKGCFDLLVFRESKGNCPAGGCDDPAAKGYKVGALIYGNTCLQDKGRYLGGANLDVHDNVDKLEIVDNVFGGKGGGNCTLPSLPPAELMVDSNVFATAPSGEACRGTNAKIGPTGIGLDYSRVNASSIPSPDSFRPSGSPDARRGGERVDRTVIDGNDYPASMREFTWAKCKPSPGDWTKGLAYDYACAPRGDKPSAGGLE
ncbi:MAG TPA: right-handed parallel beta-helix repeat-containing protein [Gammaproteobacteria bacterium]|nr:right-handed parallel beta-helix repeat-containing protein [Gammaproteobacteria bacterium]